MAGALATLDSATIERASLTEVLAWCDQGRTALERAIKLTDGTNLLGVAKTLDYVVRVRDMNQEAVIAASRLRIMAERRVGELIAVERKAGLLASNGGDRKSHLRPISITAEDTDLPATLAKHGITLNEASAYAKLAAVPAETFDAKLDECATDAGKRRVGVARAAVLRALDPDAQQQTEQAMREEAGRKFRLSLGQQIAILGMLAELPERIAEIVHDWTPNDPPLTLNDLHSARSALFLMIDEWRKR
ncbi:MAG: hypothetical protein ABI862_18415 [Ilumatobacteraceae bacterium]